MLTHTILTRLTTNLTANESRKATSQQWRNNGRGEESRRNSCSGRHFFGGGIFGHQCLENVDPQLFKINKT